MNKKYTLENIFEEFSGGIIIPRIQRGFVQGRDDEKGREIRVNFAPALVKTVFGKEELSLDFIYGVALEDEASGQYLLPLDGQQRLSTLFLLAWLCRKWKKEWHLTYESRRIPQLFVEGLLEHPHTMMVKPSEEIEDAEWFLPVWKEDPNVAGMLRMLDTLYENIAQYSQADANQADANFGRITFLLHGIDGQGDTFDHIFRKMNARGKELSPWENMKALLDKYLPYFLVDEWHDKIDGDWAECIWKHTDSDVCKLDNAMEKIVRMAYACFAGSEAQNESLWQIEAWLENESFSLEKKEAFYRMTILFFNKIESIAFSWTEHRITNMLWKIDKDDNEFWKEKDDSEFWNWLCNGNRASHIQLLRMVFLSDSSENYDLERRKRVLLNLLDASTGINKNNFAKALSVGLDFLKGKLDLDSFKTSQDGYSHDQVDDEKQKWKLDANRVIEFEKNDLVYCGSLQFIEWSDFMNETDVEFRLNNVREAISTDWIGFFCKILVRLERGNEKELKHPIAIPYDDLTRWGEYVLSNKQVIKAIKEIETGAIEPEWTAWLSHFKQLADENHRLGDNKGLRQYSGWTFIVNVNENNHFRRDSSSIRLDFNNIERKNRNLLKDEIIYYETNEKRWLTRAAKICGFGYNVWDPSWYGTTNPPLLPLESR